MSVIISPKMYCGGLIDSGGACITYQIAVATNAGRMRDKLVWVAPQIPVGQWPTWPSSEPCSALYISHASDTPCCILHTWECNTVKSTVRPHWYIVDGRWRCWGNIDDVVCHWTFLERVIIRRLVVIDDVIMRRLFYFENVDKSHFTSFLIRRRF